MTALWSTQEQKWQWWTNWDNWLWWFSDATLYRRITSQFPLVEVGNRSCTQIPFQGIGWRCRWPPLRMFRRSSQHQQHCRQVFPRYAWQHLFFLHPPTLQELISSRPDRRTIQEKTHPPSLKDLQRHAGYSVGLDLSEIFPITTAVSMLRCSHVNYAYYGRSLGDIGSCSMLFIVYSAEGVSVLPQCCE